MLILAIERRGIAVASRQATIEIIAAVRQRDAGGDQLRGSQKNVIDIYSALAD